MKNLHVINARKNYCNVKAVISKKGNNILVERQTVKKTNRKGEVHASTYLNLFECDDTGTPLKDLSGEQRRETEKILRQQIGSLDDFLMTSLASQGDINRFVNKGSAERKAILAKFLRLDILDQLQSVLRTDLATAKSALAKIPEKEFDAQIFYKSSKIKARKADRQAEVDALEKISEILSSLSSALDSSSEDIKYTEIEVTDQESLLRSLTKDHEEKRSDLEVLEIEKESLEEKLSELSDALGSYDSKHLLAVKSQISETERSLLVTTGEIETKTSQLKSDKREVKKLSDVPCGDSFPTCKYIISAHRAEKSMLEKQDDLKSTRKYATALKREIKKLLAENVEEKLREKNSHDQKIVHVNQRLSEVDISIVKMESNLRNIVRRKTEATSLLDKMRMNLCDDDTAKQRELLIKKKKIAEQKRSEAKQKIQYLSERIGLLTAEIEQLRKDRIAYEENNFHYNAINLLCKSLSRDGIPLQIVKKKLPIINSEISNILTGVTGFTVELESNNQGMDIMLDYGDSRRVIECCSGMEKMMSSLAIRTALVRVSSLPKSDMLIIDEGFGALDASNVEACTSLLRSLTKTFRTILIISHIDTVKDVVDNIIEISTSTGHDSKVTFL